MFHRRVLAALAIVIPLAACPSAPRTEQSYDALRDEIATERARLASDEAGIEAARAAITRAVPALAKHWLGTTWALGAPQTDKPKEGKINCGTFVGTVLSHAGFRVDVRKLQRQPSLWIIRTFTDEERIHKWIGLSMESFVAELRALPPGLYVIGLDFHVGFVLLTEDDARFIHASYETHTVVDEPVAEASPIRSSNYRVVGAILSDRATRAWLARQRIPVKGRW